ncbi:MAG: DUF1674 domain-containing protein [Hyphomicrobiales bacterium]|nr:DUF1674 domain-containing protein [Hyphomicrobiales bacterium]PCH51080.1 MAG: DUF1674 domain-containing protein [Hyphomicrobiales bacterium]PCH51354.1 MAG: DUF1674 domain-containing protein [Hyphomicrobiales bacterium]
MSDLENKKSVDVAQKVEAAAKRALIEANERKKLAAADEAKATPPVKEINGRGGLDPARYGDWEKKGIAVDF